MNCFNVRYNNFELRSTDDITTLAEVVLWRQDTRDGVMGEVPVVIAKWDVEIGSHSLHIMPNNFSAEDKFDVEIFKKMVKCLTFLIEQFMLNENEMLSMKDDQGVEDWDFTDTFQPQQPEDEDSDEQPA